MSTIPSEQSHSLANHAPMDWCGEGGNFTECCRTEVVCLLAAIGFNVETVTYKNIKFQVWDLGMLLGAELPDF